MIIQGLGNCQILSLLLLGDCSKTPVFWLLYSQKSLTIEPLRTFVLLSSVPLQSSTASNPHLETQHRSQIDEANTREGQLT